MGGARWRGLPGSWLTLSGQRMFQEVSSSKRRVDTQVAQMGAGLQPICWVVSIKMLNLLTTHERKTLANYKQAFIKQREVRFWVFPCTAED